MTGLTAFPPPGRRTRSQWVGRAAIIIPHLPQAPPFARYAALTISMLGLQLVWSCEMAQASPYLLSLGLSKSMMSLVFLAGPLSGLIAQPVAGVLSDGCKSSLGRRRPFIVGGCIATSVGVLLLGWSKEVASVFARSGGVLHGRLAMALAILSVYLIDFSINIVQAMDRSLLVDVIPPAEQEQANAWASRMFGIGAVFGYWVGGIDLVYFTRGWLGGEQLKVLTFFTAFFMCACHAVTVVCVKERVLISREDDGVYEDGSSATWRALGEIWVTFRTLPRPIQQVLNVQFASWIGWFPVLFFSTTWVAEIYAHTHWGSSDLSTAPTDIRELATRAGTRAMLFHSIVALSTSVLLPSIIAPFQTADTRNNSFLRSSSTAAGNLLAMVTPRPLPWLSLSVLWTISNATFAFLLLSTYFASSVGGASVIIAAAGFSWAVTNWAPFAILGDLILRIGAPAPIPLDNADSHWAAPALAPIPEERTEYDHFLSHAKKASSGSSKSSLSSPVIVTPPSRSTSAFGPHSIPPSPAGSARSDAYFDTTMDTPTQSSFPDSIQSTLPDRATTPKPRSSSTHPYATARIEYPPNHQPGFVDPYASTSSLHDPYAPTGNDVTAKVLQIRHSDSFEIGEEERESYRRAGTGLGIYGEERGRGVPGITVGDEGDDWEGEGEGEGEENEGGADQAGVILGCHNIYLVLPQFLVTGISSIVFALFAPGYSVVAGEGAPASSTITSSLEDLSRLAARQAGKVVESEWDALGMIFRIGGISAAVSAWLCWKMTRERERERIRRLRGTH